jgi:hypothetical protein
MDDTQQGTAQGAAGGAATGASVGGPWGALIGGVAGAGMGYYSGIQKEKAEKEMRRRQALKNLYAPFYNDKLQVLGAKPDHVGAGVMSGLTTGLQQGANIGRMYDSKPKRDDVMEFNPYAQAYG